MRTRLTVMASLGALLACCFFALGCGSDDDCAETHTCGATAGASHAGSTGSAGKSSGGDGNPGGADNGGTSTVAGSSNNGGNSGTNGSGGEGGGPSSGCTGDVSDDAACWTTNELGVFVSSDAADDSGDGTKEAPFKTITKGIAAAAGKNVYVCVGASDYTEKVSLDLASDGVHIYGGFECATWTYATTRSAQVLSPSNIALRIDGLKKGVHIENVSFQAADATGTGPDASSYGAFVTGSKGVVLTRVAVKAGKGAKGADGADGDKGANGAAPDVAQNGQPGLCGGTPEDADGASAPVAVCGSRGGKGGGAVLNTDGGNGFSGTPGQNVTPPNTPNLGAGASDMLDGKPGGVGAIGNAGVLGEASADAGSFASVGFTVASGHDGGSGFPGQGGGGGGASKGTQTCRGASGGAGGMGGCGGAGGKAGIGGGASVGFFSWASEVRFASSTVQASAGGAGGAGGKGGQRGVGAMGGIGGVADDDGLVARGGNGGLGGDGGRGGNGSGGTGGPSYALVYSTGMKPTYDAADTTLKPGSPGAAGVGGQQVLTTKAPDGSAGVAAPELEVQ